jgi:hypothetical protein
MEILEAIAKHPLTLLLVGAVITNYLIPRVTRRWQDRQQEIELKTAFVGEVSDAVLEMLISVQYAEVGATSQSQEDYDESYRRWETARARIGARIRGYFPATGLQDRWRTLADAVTAAYALSGTHDTTLRQARIGELKSTLPNAVIDWNTLADPAMKSGASTDSIKSRVEVIQAYRQAWFGLREAMLDELGVLVEAILDARLRWLQPRRHRPTPRPARQPDRNAGLAQSATTPPAVVPLSADTQVGYDVFGAIAPPDIDDLDESDPQSLANYAKRWFNYGNSRSALDAISRAVALAPDDPQLLHTRAFILQHLRCHSEAEEDARKATGLQPDNARHWYLLCEIRRETGQFAAALAAIERTLTIDPDYEIYWRVKGKVLDQLGRSVEADEAYQRGGTTRQEEQASEDA